MFAEPIRRGQPWSAAYFSLITRPTDFASIRRRVLAEQLVGAASDAAAAGGDAPIETFADLRDELDRCFDNAMAFTPPQPRGTLPGIHEIARDLKARARTECSVAHKRANAELRRLICGGAAASPSGLGTVRIGSDRSDFGTPEAPLLDEWLQCDRCDMWHELPSSLPPAKVCCGIYFCIKPFCGTYTESAITLITHRAFHPDSRTEAVETMVLPYGPNRSAVCRQFRGGHYAWRPRHCIRRCPGGLGSGRQEAGPRRETRPRTRPAPCVPTEGTRACGRSRGAV